MGQRLAIVAFALAVGGCSIIYNGIPPIVPDAAPDVMIDAPFDGNPAMLTLTDCAPHELLEGQGDGGSRPAILVIQGSNFVAGAQVAVSPSTSVTVDNAKIRIPASGDYLAVPVTAHVSSGTGSIVDGQMIPLTIQVTQPVPGGGTTMQTLAGKLVFHGLDELTTAPANVSNLKSMYSSVTIPAITFVGDQSHRATIRSTSSILVTGALTSKGGNASGTTAGAGGVGACAGAPANADAPCAGGGKLGSSPNILNGQGGDAGGAGFATRGGDGTGGVGPGVGGAMIGDDLILSYATNQPSGGGGGGQNGLLGGGGGGAGGGGGGVVELTADGDLTALTIDVTGGSGATSGNGGSGGGGAGGVIMVRAGRALMTGMLTAKGAATVGGAGRGSDGRIRWDAPSGNPPAGNPTPVRGPTFVSAPMIIAVTSTSLQMIGAPNHTFNVYTTDQMGAKHVDAQGVGFAADGTVTINPMLSRGFNHVCVTLVGGTQGMPEADKCIDVAYLP